MNSQCNSLILVYLPTFALAEIPNITPPQSNSIQYAALAGNLSTSFKYTEGDLSE